MSKIPFAYCLETSQEMGPDDVIEYVLKTERIPSLACADEQCRNKYPHTRISPVCCNPFEPCKIRNIPYLRKYPAENHPHASGCRFGEIADNLEYMIRHKKEQKINAHNPEANLFLDLETIQNTSLIPDEYVTEYELKETYATIETETESLVNSGIPRQQAGRIAVCKVPHKTNRLSLIVTIAEILAERNENERVQLVLPNRHKAANYRNAFFDIACLRQEFKTSYIFYGYARITRCDQGFIAEYEATLKKYCADYEELHAVTFFPDKKLATFRHGRTLLHELERYYLTRKSCCLYTFSTHDLKFSNCPADRKVCVVIEPRTLDAAVIRKRCLNRSAKR